MAKKKKTTKRKVVKRTSKKTVKRKAVKRTTAKKKPVKKKTVKKIIKKKTEKRTIVPTKRKPLHTAQKPTKSIIRYTPLSSGFMLVSIFAFLIGSIYLMDISTNYGFMLSLLGIIGVIASIISMSKAPEQGQLSIYSKNR